MSRFSSLEFGDFQPRQTPPQSRGEPIRDENFFYREGLKYWLHADFEVALRSFSRAVERNVGFIPGWLGQILMLIEMEEYPEALLWADKALEQFPEHPDFLAAKAIAYCRDEKHKKALTYSDSSISKDNVSSIAWLARAEVMMRRQRRVAENCISKAFTAAANNSQVIDLTAGRVLSRAGKYPVALEYLSKAVRHFPKAPLAWYELGNCQYRMGFKKEARVTLDQALNLNPDWDQAKALMEKLDTPFWYKWSIFRK